MATLEKRSMLEISQNKIQRHPLRGVLMGRWLLLVGAGVKGELPCATSNKVAMVSEATHCLAL